MVACCVTCSLPQVDGDLLDIAAQTSTELQDTSLSSKHTDAWIRSQGRDQLIETLQRILQDPRYEPQKTLRQIAKAVTPPIVAGKGRRSLSEMRRQADAKANQRHEELEVEKAQKKANAERMAREQHENQIRSIAKDPDAILRRIDMAIEERKRPSYQQAARDLKLVEEALGPVFVRTKVEELQIKYPNRSALHSEIRKALDG